MTKLNELDMSRIFAATETAVRARASELLDRSREERANPDLLNERQVERAAQIEQDAHALCDSIPASIEATVATGGQNFVLKTVLFPHFSPYGGSPAQVVEEDRRDYTLAVMARVEALCKGIDKLFVDKRTFSQGGLTTAQIWVVRW